MRKFTLPTDSTERKAYSLSRGCYAYFPAALAGVARHSFEAGAKHTKGELIHIRYLSNDHEDCIERHCMDLRDILAAIDRATGAGPVREYVPELLAEANALAWRALALSQVLHETYGGAPLAPAARVSAPTAPEPVPDPVPAANERRCQEISDFSYRQCTLDEYHNGPCNFDPEPG